MRYTIFTATILLLCACNHSVAEAERDLGQAIFSDASLSADGKTSCQSCHKPELAFTDGQATSIGAFGSRGTRNAPSLIGAGSSAAFFWDGRESDLSKVVMQPFINPSEMALDSSDELVKRLSQRKPYADKILAAYGDADLSYERTARSLVTYLRSLDVSQSRFEKWRSSPGSFSLSDAEASGLQLFKGRAGCAECHRVDGQTQLLTDGLHHHSGIGVSKAAGHVRTATALLDDAGGEERLGGLILTNTAVSELGRFALTREPRDLGAFRTPSLKNVGRTAPYMHDGSVGTLASALDYELYYRGIEKGGGPINLTPEERQSLLAFLHTLQSHDVKPARD